MCILWSIMRLKINSPENKVRRMIKWRIKFEDKNEEFSQEYKPLFIKEANKWFLISSGDLSQNRYRIERNVVTVNQVSFICGGTIFEPIILEEIDGVFHYNVTQDWQVIEELGTLNSSTELVFEISERSKLKMR